MVYFVQVQLIIINLFIYLFIYKPMIVYRNCLPSLLPSSGVAATRRYGWSSFFSVSPCPSLLPSSGVAGTVGYPPYPCRPVPHFSRHLGSPVRLVILLLHVALSLTSPVIWGRRYGWLSSFSMSPCPSPRPLPFLWFACPSNTPPSTLSSLILSSSSPVSPSSKLSSLCVLLCVLCIVQ